MIFFYRRVFHTRVKAASRIGPHNIDVISANNEIKIPSLNPYWVTGFTDAEGTFIISVIKSNNRALGWRVTPIFSINLHGRDLYLLLRIKSFFGVGNITINKTSGHANFSVKSVTDIYSVIIPHFCKYSLITQKQADFVLFKEIVELIVQKQHLTKEGLIKIVELRASLNKGISLELANAFHSIKPVVRPVVQLPENIDVNWFLGFIDGEGSFSVIITKSKTKVGYSVSLNFNITQHIRDVLLLKFIQKWLGCGLIFEIPKYSRVNFVLVKLNDIINILIPILNQNSLQGTKRLDFEDFKVVANLMEKKEHLTSEGLEKCKQIKSGMNTGRDNKLS